MKKESLIIGIIVFIVLIIGVLGGLSYFQKQPTASTSNTLPPISLPFTTSLSTNQTQSLTTTTTTSTITQQVKLQPYELYFLNYSDGIYWYVGVLNISLPNTVYIQLPSFSTGFIEYQEQTYHLYGYTEILLPIKIKLGAGVAIPVYIGTKSSNNIIGIALTYNGYNWTYGNL